MGHPVRPGDAFHAGDGAKGDHVAVLISSVEPADLVSLGSGGGVRLHIHLEGTAKKVEIVHVTRPQVGLQCIEDGRKRDP